MQKSFRKFIAFWLVGIIFLCMPGQTNAHAQAGSQLDFSLTVSPELATAGGLLSLSLQITAVGSPDCAGIPGDPKDFYLAFVNSGRDTTLDFSDHLDSLSFFVKANFSGQTEHSRLVILNDRSILEPESQESNILLSLETITRDTPATAESLVQRAIQLMPKEPRTPVSLSKPVLIIFFNDPGQMQASLESLLTQAADEGFQVALVFTGKERPGTETPTPVASFFPGLVSNEDILADPTVINLQKFFTHLTEGHTDWAAGNINVFVTTNPVDGLVSAHISPNGVGVMGLSFTHVDHLLAGETYTETIIAQVNPDIAEDDLYFAAAIDYVDCNGLPQKRASLFSIAVDKDGTGATIQPGGTPVPGFVVTTDTTSLPQTTITLTSGVPDQTPDAASSSSQEPLATATIAGHVGNAGEEPPVQIDAPEIPLGIQDLISWLQTLNLPAPIGGFMESILLLLGTLWNTLAPILPWILLAILILLLLWWIMSNWKNWFKPKPAEQPIIPEVPPRFDPVDCVPGWYKKLEGEDTAKPGGTANMADSPSMPEFGKTLLIGVGPVGREILSQLATVLTSWWGEKDWRKNIHLLQVDVQMPKMPGLRVPAGMFESEWVLWKPDFEEIKSMVLYPKAYRNLDVTHWQWYLKNSTQDEGRFLGRMALFNDLSDGQGQLWNALESAYQSFMDDPGVRTDPDIRIIGATFDNISSGVLIDIARITKLITNKADMQLWLTGAFADEWRDYSSKQPLTPEEQTLRSLAMLRELERSQIGTRMLYAYVPSNNASGALKQYFDDSVTQRVFLFEQRGQQQETINDVFDSMLDALLIMLHPSVTNKVAQKLQDNNEKAGQLFRRGTGVAIAIGTYSFHLTTGLVEIALAWRMVRDLFFEYEYGMKPLEKNEQSGAYTKLDTLAPPTIHAVGERALIDEWLIKLEKAEKAEKIKKTKSFGTHVADRLNKILNGELVEGVSERMISRRYALEQAERWLKQLEVALREDGRSELLRHVIEFQKEIAAWNLWLESEIYPLCVTNLGLAQDKLQRLRERNRRESDIPENLEWETYVHDIRPNKTPNQREPADQKPLMRFAARFGWQVSYDDAKEQWHLNFLAPPRSFHFADETDRQIEYHSLSRNDPQGFIQKIYELAYPYTLIGKKHYNAAEVLANKIRNGTSLRAWLTKAAPGLKFNKTIARNLAGKLDEFTTLAAPKQSNVEAVQPLLQALSHAGQMSGDANDRLSDTGNDTEMVSLLELLYWIPFETLEMYSHEQQSARVPASYFVWPSEQLASEIEKAVTHRFSNLFLSKLAQDYEWVSVFGLGLIYGIFGFDGEKWEMPGWEHHLIKAASPWDLLTESLRIENLQHPRPERQRVLNTWRDEITNRRENTDWLEKEGVGSLYEWLSQAEDFFVKPYRRDDADVIAQDWAVFLSYLINQEKKK